MARKAQPACVITDCEVAPPGSVLVFTGSGTGGQGKQYYFRRGITPNIEVSQGFEARWHAEYWATEDLIEFKPRNTSGAQSQQHERRA